MIHSTAHDTVQTLELNAERTRLAQAHEHAQPWYHWGPYPMLALAHTDGVKMACWV